MSENTYIITDTQIKSILDELQPIIDKIGPFKIDPLEFAWSVLEDSTNHANNIKNLLKELKIK